MELDHRTWWWLLLLVKGIGRDDIGATSYALVIIDKYAYFFLIFFSRNCFL